MLDLAEGEPDEIGIGWEVFVDFDYDVAVALVEEPGALFGLELVEQHAGARAVQEPVEMLGALAVVDAGVVALGGLEGGGQLDAIDVARLDLGLDEKVQHSVEFAGEAAEKTDFRLVDGWAGPTRDGPPSW